MVCSDRLRVGIEEVDMKIDRYHLWNRLAASLEIALGGNIICL